MGSDLPANEKKLSSAMAYLNSIPSTAPGIFIMTGVVSPASPLYSFGCSIIDELIRSPFAYFVCRNLPVHVSSAW